MFSANSNVQFRDMTDGSSNSIVVGERKSPGGVEGGDAIWVGIANVGLGTPAPPAVPGEVLHLGSTVFPMNTVLPYPAAPPAGWNSDIFGFGSQHAGGAHFLMGDGRIKFFSESMDLTLYQLMSSISDGQVISID